MDMLLKLKVYQTCSLVSLMAGQAIKEKRWLMAEQSLKLYGHGYDII